MEIEEILAKLKHGCGYDWITPTALRKEIAKAKAEILGLLPEMKNENMGNGKGCSCSAYGQCECGCGVDWTDYRIYNQAIHDCRKALGGEDE